MTLKDRRRLMEADVDGNQMPNFNYGNFKDWVIFVTRIKFRKINRNQTNSSAWEYICFWHFSTANQICYFYFCGGVVFGRSTKRHLLQNSIRLLALHFYAGYTQINLHTHATCFSISLHSCKYKLPCVGITSSNLINKFKLLWCLSAFGQTTSQF
jgi:hypothetical protein